MVSGDKVLSRTLMLGLMLCITLIMLNMMFYFEKNPFKCVENNLYTNDKQKLVGQNKKCTVIGGEIYIYENGNLRKVKMEDIENKIIEILEIEKLEEREGN